MDYAKHSTRHGRALALAGITLTWVGLQAVQGANPLEEARTSLQSWVETRQQISKTKSEWESDKELIQQTIELFKRELQVVEEKMADLGTNSAQVDKERVEAEALLKSSDAGLEKAREFAVAFEGQLAGLLPRLPAPLREDLLKDLINKLPTDSTNTDVQVATRVQTLVGILNELDKFNNSVTIFSEKRRNERGEEAAVQTVYIGLGAAYFVNESGDFAGMGAPGETGWEWTTKPELDSAVTEVIRIYRNERTARFVSLPVVIR